MNEAWLEHLDLDACLKRLRAESVGRVAIILDGSPTVLPVNFRLVETPA